MTDDSIETVDLLARVIVSTKAGAERAQADGFALTPIEPRHVKRLAELKRARDH